MCLEKEYIYVLTHVKTGKKYVGRSKQPKERYRRHMWALKRGAHNNNEMQSDYSRYGGDYTFEIVSEEHKRLGKLDSDERKWMIKLKTYDERYGYNTKDYGMVTVRANHGLPVDWFYEKYERRKARG